MYYICLFGEKGKKKYITGDYFQYYGAVCCQRKLHLSRHKEDVRSLGLVQRSFVFSTFPFLFFFFPSDHTYICI